MAASASSHNTLISEHLGKHKSSVFPLENIPQRVAHALKKRDGKRLVDILNPPCRPKMPIELPPVNERRKKLQEEIPQEKNSAEVVFLQVPHVDGDDEGNPFRIPPDIFQFNQEWDEQNQTSRSREGQTSSKKKETSSYKQAQTVLNRIKPFLERSSKMSRLFKTMI